MQNKLINWLKDKNVPIRDIAKQTNLSPGYISLVFNGKRSVTWEFAARVANRMGLDYMDAFEMAGLIPHKKGDSRAGAAPAYHKPNPL